MTQAFRTAQSSTDSGPGHPPTGGSDQAAFQTRERRLGGGTTDARLLGEQLTQLHVGSRQVGLSLHARYRVTTGRVDSISGQKPGAARGTCWTGQGPLEANARLLHREGGLQQPSTRNCLQGGFPGGAVVKNPPANTGDSGSSPGPRRSHMLRSN